MATKAEKQWKAAVLRLRERTTWAACGRRGDTACERKPGRVLRSRRKTAGNTVENPVRSDGVLAWLLFSRALELPFSLSVYLHVNPILAGILLSQFHKNYHLITFQHLTYVSLCPDPQLISGNTEYSFSQTRLHL